MNTLAVAITIVLVVLTIYLIWKESESWATKVINFIGIFSGLLGLFSTYMSLDILKKVETIEDRRERVAQKLRDNLYFRDEIAEIETAMIILSQKTNENLLKEEETLRSIQLIHSFSVNNKEKLNIETDLIKSIAVIEYQILKLHESNNSEEEGNIPILISELNQKIGSLRSSIKTFKTQLLSEELVE